MGLLGTYQDADIHEDLVTKNVDVEFVGNIPDEFHKHVLLGHFQQFISGLPLYRRSLVCSANKLSQ